MKRFVLALLLGYVLLALVGRAIGGGRLADVRLRSDCWCKKTGLSLFRWVFPRFHSNAGLEAWKMRRLDESG